MTWPAGFVWRLAMFTPSTITLSVSLITRVIVAAPADVLAREHTTSSPFFSLHAHNTSGASETIRMKRRSRSSRPTGPKMRVPRGCIWSLISTAAFSSKRM